MKIIFKNYLSHLGLLPILDSFRGMPAMCRWMAHGFSGVAPPSIKRKILMAYLHKFALKNFIETGTYLGDTLAYMAHDKNIHCISIELADNYYKQAKIRFEPYANIKLLHGDSGALMPDVVKQLNVPALFWLDGHYSGGLTAQGDNDTPVSAELEAIFTSQCKKHVILIDDARCFNGSNGYPHLDDLLNIVRQRSCYAVEVSADIIRITPK
jgi:hypothetical protein